MTEQLSTQHRVLNPERIWWERGSVSLEGKVIPLIHKISASLKDS